MARVWSTEAEPHRVLKLYEDPQQGEDVRAVQVACKKRLGTRGIHRDFTIDGVFGEKTKAALDTGAWAMGALQATIGPESFSIGAQAMIRYPGRRTDEQLARADDRMERWRKERDAGAIATKSPSGLSSGQIVRARDLTIASFNMLYRHAPEVHYTQDARRWEGIGRDLKAYQGEYPNYADCSSAFTWAWWNGLDHYGVADILNGQGWNAGYTGSLLLHGREVSVPTRGCAVIYGARWPGVHVAMYDEDGKVYSHGSEGGPYYVDMHYRTDILSVRKFV